MGTWTPVTNQWSGGGPTRWASNWYGTYQDSGWDNLLNDPGRAAYQWAYANRPATASNWAERAGQINAMEMARALGVANTYSPDSQANLDAIGRVYNAWMGENNGIRFSARDIINNLYNTNSQDAQNVGSLSDQFLTVTPDTDPDANIDDLVKFMRTTVLPLVGRSSWNAYQRTLADQGNQYRHYIDTMDVAGGQSGMSFLDWLKRQLGSGLGLY